MMNLDPIPPVPNTNSVAANFLDLLADPAAARKLIEELNSSKAAAEAAYQEARTLQNEVTTRERKLAADLQTFDTNKKAHSAFLADAGDKLDKRHNELNIRESQLAADREAHSRAVSEHNADVAAHEAAKSAHAAALNRHANDVAELKLQKAQVDKWLVWLASRPQN